MVSYKWKKGNKYKGLIMSVFNKEKGIIIFDNEEKGISYSFKLDYKSKKVIYNKSISSFLQDVKKVALSNKEFTRKLEHVVDRNRHIVFSSYAIPEFRDYICKGMLHLERTTSGYNIPKDVTPGLVDSLFDYNTIINHIPVLGEFLKRIGAFEVCEVCEKENGYTHLDKDGTLYVGDKKVLEGCICCPKCGKKI